MTYSLDHHRFNLTAGDLAEVRQNADWRRVFDALQLVRAKGRGNANDWWASSPFARDSDPSFHMSDRGWYCFSSGKGGGVLELIQERFGLDCYAAAHWLLENGLSTCSRLEGAAPSPAPPVSGEKGAEAPPRTPKEPNRPIRQNLVPALATEHPEFERRGISPDTCAYLGCGYYGKDHKPPLADRIVFQVRGVAEQGGELQPVVYTHMGRALSEEEAAANGKWRSYGGFHKTLEIYNIDKLLLDEAAVEQARQAGRIILVEGCFDVAKLVEADIRNVGATFGSHLSDEQLVRLRQIAERTAVRNFLVWYDRDKAGDKGQQQAVDRINQTGDLTAEGFDWNVTFPSPTRGRVQIPDTVKDPGECAVQQIRFLRERSCC